MTPTARLGSRQSWLRNPLRESDICFSVRSGVTLHTISQLRSVCLRPVGHGPRPSTRGRAVRRLLDSTCSMLHNDLDMLREIIVREIKRQGLSVAELTRRCNGEISRRALIYYIDGEYDLSSKRVDVLLKVLGLKVARRSNRGKAPRRHA